jgi:hypothetical protein
VAVAAATPAAALAKKPRRASDDGLASALLATAVMVWSAMDFIRSPWMVALANACKLAHLQFKN